MWALLSLCFVRAVRLLQETVVSSVIACGGLETCGLSLARSLAVGRMVARGSMYGSYRVLPRGSVMGDPVGWRVADDSVCG